MTSAHSSRKTLRALHAETAFAPGYAPRLDVARTRGPWYLDKVSYLAASRLRICKMKLFSPLHIAGIKINNRLVRSATGEGAAELNTGRPTPAMADFYKRLAEGGVGLVISGHVAVSPEGRCNQRMTACTGNDFIPAFRHMVDACHAGGAPIVCQLNHGGRQVNAAHRGIRPLCPSKADFPGAAFHPDVLEEADILRIIADFADAARRVRQAGFDGVQIHSAHGYLISQFNSPLTNRREDNWGGSPAERRRFLMETYAAVRNAVGKDYPVMVKQNVSEFHPGGMELEEATAICAELDAAGIDAIELSGGIAETIPIAFRAKELKATREVVFFEEQCRRIRSRVACPLILTGGIRRRATAERLLAEGVCNTIGMCRPFIREPGLPNAWRKGTQTQAACISCGKCRQDPEHCNTCGLL